MGAVRDPAFWKRFSMAVHMDEEKANSTASRSTSSSSKTTPIKQETDWLERNRRKSKRTRVIGCLIALLTLIFILGVIGVFLWLGKVGPFAPVKPSTTAPPHKL